MTHRLAVQRGTVGLLRDLADQLQALHDEADPTNPAWARLYPTATNDPRLDDELRSLVHPDVARARREALDDIRALLRGLDDDAVSIALDDDEAVLFLGVVNDVRLALAASVDLPGLVSETGELPDRLANHVRATVELVEWLAYLQEQVLSSLAPASQAHFDDPFHRRADSDGPAG